MCNAGFHGCCDGQVVRALDIISKAEASLGDLSGMLVDLLLDNMPDLKNCDEARSLIKNIGR